jgi:hypothetical protein
MNQPWKVEEVSVSTAGFHLKGVNHCFNPPQPFRWTVDYHSFRDPEYTGRNYDFTQAVIAPDAVTPFLNMVRWGMECGGRA